MKKVLFVCVGNSCRSQMAKGFFNYISENAFGESAGTKPEDKIDPKTVEVMREKNIDISSYVPKLFTSSMNNQFDYIVSMGCIDLCPITPKNKTIEWNVNDPKGKNIVFYRKIRDEIENNVKKLIDEVILKMKIEILGTGCPKCKATEKIVKKAVEELGIEAEIVKVEDLQEIIDRGVMMTPAVVVDDEVKIVGHTPSVEEVKKIIK